MMGGYRGLGYGYDMMDGAWGSVLALLFGLLVIAGIVLLVLWAVRASSGQGSAGSVTPPPASPGHDEALAIARKRLASGEITCEQYEEIARTLTGERPPTSAA